MEPHSIDPNNSLVSSLTSSGRRSWQLGDGAAALKSFRDALAHASHPDSEETDDVRSWCSFNAGTCLLGLGQASESIPFLKQAASTGDRGLKMQVGLAGDELQRNAKLHHNLALAQAAVGQHTEAVEQYKQAAGAFKRLRLGEDEGSTLLHLADSYKALQRYEPASKCYRRALEIYQESKNEGGLAFVHSEVASLSLQLGRQEDVEEAKAELDLATLLAQKIGDRKMRGRVYCTVGSAYASLHQHENALVCLRKALQDIRSLPDTRQQEATILQNIGGVYNLLQCYQESLVFHQQALGLFESQENTSAMAITLANLAFAQASLGNLEEAEVTFLHAEQVANAVDDRYTLARVWEGLAAIYFHSKQTEQSMALLKKAISSLSSVPQDTTTDINRLVDKLSLVLAAENRKKPKNQRQPHVSTEQQLAEHSLQVTKSSVHATAVISNEPVSSDSSSLELPDVSSLSSSDSEDGNTGKQVRRRRGHSNVSHRKGQQGELMTDKHSGTEDFAPPDAGPSSTPTVAVAPLPRKRKSQGRRKEKQQLQEANKPPSSRHSGGVSWEEPSITFTSSPPPSPRMSSAKAGEEVIHRRSANVDADVSSLLMANLTMDAKTRRQQKAVLAGFGTNTPTGLKLRQSMLGGSSPPQTPSSPGDWNDGKTESKVCVLL